VKSHQVVLLDSNTKVESLPSHAKSTEKIFSVFYKTYFTII